MLEMERRASKAPHELDSSGSCRQGDAFSGLPRFPAVGRLVRLFALVALPECEMFTCGTLQVCRKG